MDTDTNTQPNTPNNPEPSAPPGQPTPPPETPIIQPQQPAMPQQHVVQPSQPVEPAQSSVAQSPTPPTQPAPEPAAPAPQQPAMQPQPQPGVTPAQHSAPHAPQTPKNKKRSLLFIVLAVLFAISTSLAVYFGMDSSSARSEISDLKASIAELDKNQHELPEGLIKVTECIPNMGFHYIDPNNDPRLGPTYLVSNDGKVIGYEFMFDESMLTDIPNQEIALEVLLTDGPIDLHDWQYNSIDFSRSPEGHGGYEQDHFDVHLYTVTPEVQAQACE